MTDALLSRAEVAYRLGCTERTVDNLRARGLLTPIKVGGRSLYERAAVDEYVRRHRQSHRVDPGEDLSKFVVQHAERQQAENGRRRTRSFLLTPTVTNCNDRPLVLSEGQFDALKRLTNWDGSDLTQATARGLLKELDWLDQVIALLRQGRGLTVERRIGS